MLAIEASDGPLYLPLAADPPRPPGVIALQVQLLKDAGYIQAEISPIRESLDIVGAIIRMTNSGYDYLDTVRDPKVWNQTKSVLEKIGGSAALGSSQGHRGEIHGRIDQALYRMMELSAFPSTL